MKTFGYSYEKGFTLVEIAIVILIIAVLSVGVLKGRELIENSRIAASVSQIQDIDSALTEFWNKYQAIPGDMVDPGAKIANCTGVCAQAGNGNNELTRRPFSFDVLTSENSAFWAQLAAAGLLSGVNPNPSGLIIGESNPKVPVAESAYRVGSHRNNEVLSGATRAAIAPAGLYLCTSFDLTIACNNGASYSLTPNQVMRIDTKLDDGLPNTGKILALGGTGGGSTNCAEGGGANDAYNFEGDRVRCNMYVHISY